MQSCYIFWLNFCLLGWSKILPEKNLEKLHMYAMLNRKKNCPTSEMEHFDTNTNLVQVQVEKGFCQRF